MGSSADLPLLNSLALHLQAFGADPRKVVLLDRALPLSPWLNLADRDELSTFLRLADTVPRANWIGPFTETRLSELFPDILSGAEWGRVPFTPKESEAFDELARALFVRNGDSYVPTAGYAKFMEYRTEYRAVQLEYDRTPPDKRTTQLKNRLQRSRDRLDNDAQGPLYTERERRLMALLRFDGAHGQRQDVERQYTANLDAAGQPITSVFPALDALTTEWSHHTVSGKVGSDPVPAPFGYTPGTLRNGFWLEGNPLLWAVAPDQVELDFDACLVEVRRPWLNVTGLFESRLWRWRHGLLSDGRSPQAPSDDGLDAPPLRVLTDALILIRNLRLRAPAMSGELLAAMARPASSLRLGTFAISGAFSTPLGPQEVRPVPFARNTVLVPAVQLVGVRVRPVALTPNPLPDLVWGDSLPNLPIDDTKGLPK